MNRLYFVRHGQSQGNKLSLHQSGKTELTEHGIKQAGKVAKRFRTIPIDIIFASDYARAKKTAEIINRVVGKKIEITKLLRERKRQSEIEGKRIADPEAIRVRKIAREHMDEEGWHFSDEENYFDFKKRVKDFLNFITQRKEENILVVTHAFFIKVFTTLLIIGEEGLTPKIISGLDRSLWMQNTGITVFDKVKNRLMLMNWNDQAHLG